MADIRPLSLSLALGCALVLLAACKPGRELPPSVDDLMEDRVALDGIAVNVEA